MVVKNAISAVMEEIVLQNSFPETDSKVLRSTLFLAFLYAYHDTLDDYGIALTHGILPGIPF